jgi:hypothetical protein
MYFPSIGFYLFPVWQIRMKVPMAVCFIIIIAIIAACLVLKIPEGYTPWPQQLRPNPPPDFHLFTVVTDATHPNLKKLQETALAHGIQLKILNVDVPIGHGTGFGMKLKASKDYLATLPSTDIAMFVDGYDVLIGGTANDIVATYLEIVNGRREHALFGAETNCWPDAHVAKEYPLYPTSRYKYLCSGVYISYVSTLRTLLEGFSDKQEGWGTIDDQRFFTDVYLKKPHRIVLDSRVQLISNLSGDTHNMEYDAVVKKWKNVHTQTYPLIFHGNGDSKHFLFESVYPTLQRLPKSKREE